MFSQPVRDAISRQQSGGASSFRACNNRQSARQETVEMEYFCQLALCRRMAWLRPAGGLLLFFVSVVSFCDYSCGVSPGFERPWVSDTSWILTSLAPSSNLLEENAIVAPLVIPVRRTPTPNGLRIEAHLAVRSMTADCRLGRLNDNRNSS